MKRFVFIFTAFIFLSSFIPVMRAESQQDQTGKSLWTDNLPVYDHVVIIVEENKDLNMVIGNSSAPYINNTLKKEGASFTQMYGEEHHSQGNYFWLFSGSNHHVGYYDVPPRNPINASNLGEQLIKKFDNPQAFKGYSEDLPSIGYKGNVNGNYARKHIPWISFANVPNGSSLQDSANLRFADFPADFNQLPKVSFVIPNQIHDMHNGIPPASVQKGDIWLQNNINSYYQWAKIHNSLLILTFDEDSHFAPGLTDPGKIAAKNQIPTIFAGAHIKPGEYPEDKGITHVNILRTLEAMYGLDRSGAQQINAVKAGITDDYILTDVFESVK
jgi:hypothetical protein